MTADVDERSNSLSAASSFLFVGADDERRLRKALESRADVVIADLEDAVAPARKRGARETLARVLGDTRRARGLITVRINGAGTTERSEDEELVSQLPIDGIVVPKAAPADLPAADVPLIPIVETAVGLRSAFEVGKQSDVVRLMLGSVDLSVQLGLSHLPHSTELLHARSSLVLDSCAAGIASPIDGVSLDVRDRHRVRAEASYAQALGFGGKACIHPSQIAIVDQVFAPSAHEIAWARRVDEGYRAALADGQGATLVGGEMVDAPIARRAQQILAQAGERG